MKEKQSQKQKTYPQERIDLLKLNSVIRHRLRNLCCGMKMSINRISDKTSSSYPELVENYKVMLNEFDNLMNFTERMDLLFDELNKGEPMTLFQLITDARKFFSESFPFQTIDLDGSEATVTINNGTWLQIVLRELLSNAAEADGDRVRLSWSLDKSLIVIIENSGECFQEDIPVNPPVPFSTRKGRHDGLGLSIIQRIVETLNGHFELKYTDNTTVATIVIPPEELIHE